MFSSAFLVAALLPVPAIAAELAELPSPQLLALEKDLTVKLEDRKQGRIPPDQYKLFAAQFRSQLDLTLSAVGLTPVNLGRHAMILARLDESGPGQALAGLDQALRDSPDNSELLNAKGSIQLQQGDYTGALASAEAVLKYNQDHGQPPDPSAVALRQFSKGRAPPRSSGQSPAPATPQAAIGQQSSRPAIQFSERPKAGRVEVPLGEIPQAANPSSNKKFLGWFSEQISKGQQYAVSKLDSHLHFQPGEAEIALSGATNGAIIGATGGVVIAGVACSPTIATGGAALPCLAAGGAGGVLALTPVGAFSGGYLAVKFERYRKQALKMTGASGETE